MSKHPNSRFQKIWRYIAGGKTKWILLAVLALLIGFRLALPYIVKSYVNKTLADIHGYTGTIDDVDIALWRGAYVIYGMNIETNSGTIPVPFFSSRQIDLSIEWSALLHASLVGKILFIDPKINFVQGSSEKESQYGERANFIGTLKKLFPVKFNRFDVWNGEVHFRNFSTTPNVDIHLDSLVLHATNLTNSLHLSKSLVAAIDASGKAMHTGRLKGHLDIDPYAPVPTFNLDVRLEQVNLVALNSFFKAYVLVDAESGTFSMYSEMAAADGKFTGYVKPLFKDMRILNLKNDLKNPLKLLWEALVEAVAQLFTNHSTGELATKIPLSGSFDNKNVDILATIGGILKNAFIRALQPGIEGTVNLKSPKVK